MFFPIEDVPVKNKKLHWKKVISVTFFNILRFIFSKDLRREFLLSILLNIYKQYIRNALLGEIFWFYLCDTFILNCK